jgi:hypothetical protein
MAALSQQEFHRAVDRLSGQLGFDRLKDRLARVGAFTSKRGLGSVTALADRLYMLTGGLRREGVASMGFHSMWSDVFTARVDKADETAIGEVTDRINACLEPDQSIHPEKLAVLDSELATYHRLLAAAVGEDVARLDMLMKAVPAIAERIRSWPGDAPPAAAAPPAEETAPESAPE